MKILFVGDDWYGSNARSLADGFRLAGHDVVVIDTTAVTLPKRGTPPWMYAKATGKRHARTIEAVHQRLSTAAATMRPDLLFCYKSIFLDQARLFELPSALKIHYSADDVSNPYNTTPEYLAAEQCWDAIVTTKAHNVSELRARGARHAVFVLSAFDPAWHHPVARRTAHTFTAGFVGVLRPDRVELVTELAHRYGDAFYVAGPGWRRHAALKTSGAHTAGAQYGEALSVAIAPILANLVLLNSDNRDTHTCRTFEVPAAGGLFVGPRTIEHAELLTDEKEAFLFDTPDELKDILDRCAADPATARAVAERGHRAITTGGHTYRHRAEQILASVV
ncbi:glycosyltransferase [Skermania sp. ID1734]|uniref:CgeB family protein n=1 Tax=Skermania sp. ID1734 TaxID=2597516 RepID=UPI0011800EFD|nr:glycosyltransferase [Skermania sp. ID1734]TSE00394.1 glycosyltransferase [Skermania sp. ID1734]